MSDPKEQKKELARLKRKVSELAGQIHDIVEETLWQDYGQLPDLSQALIQAVETAKAYQSSHDL